MMVSMDLLDGEPCLKLLPRRVVKAAGLATLRGVALVPPVRQWWIDQAVQHVTHEVQPLITDLLGQVETASGRGDSTPLAPAGHWPASMPGGRYHASQETPGSRHSAFRLSQDGSGSARLSGRPNPSHRGRGRERTG